MAAADYEIAYYLESSIPPIRGGHIRLIDPLHPDDIFIWNEERQRHELLGRFLTLKEAADRPKQRELFAHAKKSWGTRVVVEVRAIPVSVKVQAKKAAVAQRDKEREAVA